MKSKSKKTHNLRKVLPFYAEDKLKLILTCFFMICTGVMGIFAPILSANVLTSIAESKFELAIKITIIIFAINLIKIIFNAFTEALFVRINLKVQHNLTNALVCVVNNTQMKKLDSVKIGSITERLGMDIYTVSSSYLQIIDMVFEIITNVAFLIYIAFLNIWIFLLLLVYVVVLYFICSYKAKVWIRGRKQVKQLKDKARSSYIEQIHGIRDVKVLNIKENITNYSNNLDKNTISADLKFNDKRNIIRRIQTLVSSLFLLVFIVLGVIFVNKNLLLLTGFLVIYSYYGRVDSLVSYISSLKENLADGEISASRIFDIIDCYEKEKYGNEVLTDFSGRIELKNVDFGYTEGEQVLNGVNMLFEPNQMTAIVGKSGGGKTTILSLLAKLYDKNSGEILFDDKEIDSLTENSIHSNIGIVSQSPYIFNTSIKQNLLFVKPDATDAELISVLKQAQIYDDIKRMKASLDSEIGENGIKLSGGQKQRLAIARILLMNSKVIVLDEATSALDNDNQNKIVNVLESLKKDKTIIIVAHRLSTIVGADKIYVIADGKNIADGNHKQLMKKCKDYKDLYLMEEKNAKIEEK